MERDAGYTVVGIIEDGAELNELVRDLRRIRVGREDLTVVLKRGDPDEPEPFPDGTRYIVVPDDSRGLALVGWFVALFAVSGLLFAFTTPTIGRALFLFFIGVAAVFAISSFIKVGVTPILTDMEAPSEESGFWDQEFENGKVLVFASTDETRALRAIWEVFRERGIYFDVIERRMTPRAVQGAVLHGAEEQSGEKLAAEETQEA